jgi:hypothetical protein
MPDAVRTRQAQRFRERRVWRRRVYFWRHPAAYQHGRTFLAAHTRRSLTHLNLSL